MNTAPNSPQGYCDHPQHEGQLLNPITRGIALKVAAIAAFAVMDACLKTLSADYGSFQVTFFRGVAALPFVIALVTWKGAWGELKTAQWGLHIVRSLLAISMLAAIVFAFRALPLADAYTIFYAAPMFVTLLSIVWLKERVGWHRWAAILVGFIAVLSLFQPAGLGFSWATMACLYSTVVYAVLVIVLKLMHRKESTLSLTFYFTLGMTLGSAGLSMIDWQPIQVDDIGVLLLLGLSGAVAQLLLTEAYRLAPASALAPFEYSSLIWAIGLGWMLWDDIPSSTTLLTAGVLIATGLYILHRENMHQKKVKAEKNRGESVPVNIVEHR